MGYALYGIWLRMTNEDRQEEEEKYVGAAIHKYDGLLAHTERTNLSYKTLVVKEVS